MEGSFRWWHPITWVVTAVLGSMGVQAFIAVIRAWVVGESWVSAATVVSSDPLSLGVAQLLGFGFALMMAVRASGSTIDVQPVPGRMLVLAAIAGASLQLPFAELGNVVLEVVGRDLHHEQALRHMLHPEGFIDAMAVLFAVLVVAPVTEELLFRGLILPRLSDTYGRWAGLLGSALLFGLMHGRPAPMVYGFAAGLVLGAVRIRTGALLPCVVLHAFTNAVPLLVPADSIPIESVNMVGEHVPIAWLLAGSTLSVIALAGIGRTSDATR